MFPFLVKLKISPKGDIIDYKLNNNFIMITLTFYHTYGDTQDNVKTIEGDTFVL